MLKGNQIHGALADSPFIGQAPAALALLVQGLAFFLSLLVLAFFDFNLSESQPMLGWVLLQAILATALSALFRMASWWRWIHFFFPLVIYASWVLRLPNDVYLMGFCVTAALFWTTFRSQVPFYPSRLAVRQKVADIIPQTRSIRLIDIGSGLGDLSMYLASSRPECQIEGIEIAPLPWAISRVRAWFSGSGARFFRGDYHRLHFADYDVVFAYLSPAAMPALWAKVQREMREGTLLISYEFDIPGTVPSLIVPTSETAPPIYVWTM